MMSLERLMLDHSPSMMLLVEPTQLQIVMANQGACQTLGYPEEALLGMTITNIESSLQDVFYWEDVRNGQYLDINGQEGLYQCADASLLTVIKSVRVVDHQEFAAATGASTRCAKRAPGRGGPGADALAIASNTGVDRQRHSGHRLAGADCQHEPPVQRHVAYPRRPPA
jgi:PAS domain S-box-containing protein